MERLGRIFGLALLLLAVVPAQAQQLPPAGTPRPVPVVFVPKPLVDAATRCGVFAPPSLAQPFPHLKWSGACRDGLAEGRGTASFAATSTAAAHKIWQGNFRNGFFLGEASVPGAIIAISSYLAGIELLHTAPQEGRVWLRSTMTGEAGLPPCPTGAAEVSIETPVMIAAADEARMRRLMQLAVIAYRKACPTPMTIRLVVFTGGFYKPVLIARAGLAANAAPDAIHSFQNLAAGDTDPGGRTRMQEERRQDSAAESRRNWQDFTRANQGAVWVTPRQLDISPAQYEGRMVALPSRFARVLAPGTAILQDIRWGRVLVSGLPNHMMQMGNSVVIAGRSLGRQKLPNTITNAEISAIAATSWKLCRDPACLDYVLWMEEEKSFAWGADQSQFLK